MTMETRQRLRDSVAEEVCSVLGRRRMSGAKLAKAIDRSEMYVSRRLRAETAFDLDDLERIADVLGVAVTDLLPRGGQRVSVGEVTTRYPRVAKRPTARQSIRSVPATAHRPNRRPRAATSPARGTPEQATRRPAIVRSLARA